MIDNLKDLEKILKLCRKQGVTELKLNGCEFKLGDMPQDTSSKAIEISDSEEDPYKNFPTGILTPEQLMFYSSGGSPDDDPVRQDQ